MVWRGLEAAETLGMSVWQQIRFVIVPHIAKAIYPALARDLVRDGATVLVWRDQ